MSDLIRKAVELADGFEVHNGRELRVLTNHGTFYVDYDQQFFLDALAAQLVRQVDALAPDVLFDCGFDGEAFVVTDDDDWMIGGKKDSRDRTLNTITAIVESGVLDDKEVEE